MKTDINAPEFMQLSRYLADAVNDAYQANNICLLYTSDAADE